MGLDLIVEGCAKPGCEAEWRRILERAFADETLTDAETARFNEVSLPAYARVGAPRVGHDAAADAWILEVREAETPEAAAEVLKTFHGHYALPLVQSDGLPKYSHAGCYAGVDETSFRGAALRLCPDVLAEALVDRAWTHMFPDEAVAYGRALLDAADAAEAAGPGTVRPEPKRGLLSRLGLGRRDAPAEAFEDQLDIARTAGRWFVFWGERGHPIRAWY